MSIGKLPIGFKYIGHVAIQLFLASDCLYQNVVKRKDNTNATPRHIIRLVLGYQQR